MTAVLFLKLRLLILNKKKAIKTIDGFFIQIVMLIYYLTSSIHYKLLQ